MDLIKACFPYPNARKGQLELIEEGIAALEGGARYLLIDAPTGTGKTPIAITIAAYFSRTYRDNIFKARQYMVDQQLSRPKSQHTAIMGEVMTMLGPHQAHMVTSLKMLQDQYIDKSTRDLVVLMKGKNNYRCLSGSVAPKTSCSDYEAIYGDGRPCNLPKHVSCAYEDAKQAARLARLTLHNFDSFISQASIGGSFLPRSVLTIDEAHGTEEKIIDAISFEVNKGMILDCGGQWTVPNISKADDVKAWASHNIQVISAHIASMKLESDQMKNGSQIMGKAEFKRLRELGIMIRAASEQTRKMERFTITADKPWVFEVGDSADGDTVKFEPVKASYFAQNALLRFGEKCVLLSATLLDGGRRVMAGLNIPNDKAAYIAAPCHFPVSSRRIVSTQAVNTGQKEYRKNLAEMCAEIKKIIDAHPGVRGVIHANSYGMAKDIADGVASSRIISHTSKDRTSVVGDFVSNSPHDAVLVGVFIKEGYDFKDDMCRFQIIPRIPYPFVSKRIEARKEIDPMYYDWLTSVDLMQACGRGTRSATDMCVTYIIDNRFRVFLQRNIGVLPQWFTEAIEVQRR